MAYLVAQMIKDSSNNGEDHQSLYMKAVSVEKTMIASPNPFGEDYQQNQFLDFAIRKKNLQEDSNNDFSFLAKTTYYIRFKIHRIPQYYYSGNHDEWSPNQFNDADSLGISLVLTDGLAAETSNVNEQGHKTPETIGRFEVPTFTEDILVNGQRIKKEQYSSYAFVFTPSVNFKYLCFRITRINYDAYFLSQNKYRKWLLEDPKGSTVSRYSIGSWAANPKVKDVLIYDSQPRIYFDGTDSNSDICTLVNLVPLSAVAQSDNQKWLKFGYQSRPGSLIVVNNEPIIVGRSGIYELNNGTEIDSFMIASPNGNNASQIDSFLLDYAYNG